ncbi:hypothetical protein ACFOWE_14800 [Planomonospora corallina]|uniref:Uncharacterized protein n=1 Tax=Planomonospora corallina TaxID=1806052 RepID=A0ABV8I6L8_9ACTN
MSFDGTTEAPVTVTRENAESLVSRALDQTGALIARIGPEQAALPPPAAPGTCGRWSTTWWTRSGSSPR